MTDDEAIRIITAHKEGKQIQINRRRQSNWKDGTWYDVTNPLWNFDECDYRVKPEPRKPREWWICERQGAAGWDVFPVSDDPHPVFCCHTQYFKVQEVLEIRE